MSALRRLSENLFLFEDTCNVYVVRNGQRCILIDFGSGQVLDHLEEVGVQEVDWVLHTHHHRDQCQGDWILNQRNIPIAVPCKEAQNFEEAENFWRNRQTMDNYDLKSDFYTLRSSVKIARTLGDYERFAWRGTEFDILPTAGHTKGSISIVGEVDGSLVAFCGDLINWPGEVWRIHDLQWKYNSTDGINVAIMSLHALKALNPNRLLPSHGVPMGRPAAAIDQLVTNLSRLFQVNSYTPDPVEHPVLAVNYGLTPVSRHLWANSNTVANTYAIVTDDGRCMLLDYGFPSSDHFSGDYRFAEHSLQALRELAGMESVEVAIPSHYHDDHVGGLPLLQRKYGTKIWAYENFSDILENPYSYNIPCLLPDPIRVDRKLKDEESFNWGGFRFQVFHAPGHTHYANQVFAEVDGLRIAFTGDNVLSSLSGPRLGGPIYRNRFDREAFLKTLQALLDFEPRMLLTGHSGAMSADKEVLDQAYGRARELGMAFTFLVEKPEELNFAIDPQFIGLYPYRAKVAAGESVAIRVTVRNHHDHAAAFSGTPDLPDGWKASPAVLEAEIAAGAEHVFELQITVPRDQPPAKRIAYCLDVTFGEYRFGQEAEGLIDVLAPAAPARAGRPRSRQTRPGAHPNPEGGPHAGKDA